MDRHFENATAVVEMLVDHPQIEAVMYPGLADHPGHAVAAAQMRNFGGMVSFRPAGGVEAAHRIVTSTKVFTLAESLGAVESLIEIPAGMTHGSTAGSPLEVDPTLIEGLWAQLEGILLTNVPTLTNSSQSSWLTPRLRR